MPPNYGVQQALATAPRLEPGEAWEAQATLTVPAGLGRVILEVSSAQGGAREVITPLSAGVGCVSVFVPLTFR
jgi:hypothetical protein